MSKKHYLFYFGLIIPLIMDGQEIFSSAGGSMSDNTVQVNWTIGEQITEVSLNNISVVTSGFNQPFLKIISLIENIQTKVDLSIFPNPTSQVLNIIYGGQLPMMAKIISINGQVLSYKQILESHSQLDFSTYSNGIYLIEISEQSGKSNTYRIIKQ